jgi:hypothetical protein
VRAQREEIFSRLRVATGGGYKSPQNFSSGIYCCQMHYRVNHVTGYTLLELTYFYPSTNFKGKITIVVLKYLE